MSKRCLRSHTSQPIAKSNMKRSVLEEDVDDIVCLGVKRVNFSQPAKLRDGRVKRTRDSNDFLPSQSRECVSLVDRFPPRYSTQLGVNQQKVTEVRNWLEERIEGDYRGFRTLLLTGPSGSGKTATVRVLAEELGLEIVEYSGEHVCDVGRKFGDEIVTESSDVDTFCSFLRSVEYNGLLEDEPSSSQGKRRPKVAIIEHLPYSFYNDIRLFHETASSFITSSKQIIVFIQPNVDSCWEVSPRRLFPKEFVEKNEISEISFNSVAVTFLVKALERVAAELKLKCPKSELKRIAEESEGDIRCAINSLSLSIDENGNWKKGFRTMAIEQIGTFHMLGRLLYAKRTEHTKESTNRENHLHSIPSRRPPSERDVNSVLERGCMRDEQTVSFLAEHSPRFSASLSSLSHILDNISLCDSLCIDFQTKQRLPTEYSSQIAARSVMYYNFGAKLKFNGLYKFTKPKLNDIMTEVRNLRREVDRSFRMQDVEAAELYTLTIPMLNSVNYRLDAFQMRCVGYLGRPMNFSYSLGKDNWIQSIQGNKVMSRQSIRPATAVSDVEEEQFNIEEADSDSDF